MRRWPGNNQTASTGPDEVARVSLLLFTWNVAGATADTVQEFVSSFSEEPPRLLLFQEVSCSQCPEMGESYSDWWIFTCHPEQSHTFRGLQIYASKCRFRAFSTRGFFQNGMFLSLTVGSDDKEILMCNVHLPHENNPRRDFDAALAALTAALMTHASDAKPVLLGGDFNADFTQQFQASGHGAQDGVPDVLTVPRNSRGETLTQELSGLSLRQHLQQMPLQATRNRRGTDREIGAAIDWFFSNTAAACQAMPQAELLAECNEMIHTDRRPLRLELPMRVATRRHAAVPPAFRASFRSARAFTVPEPSREDFSFAAATVLQAHREVQEACPTAEVPPDAMFHDLQRCFLRHAAPSPRLGYRDAADIRRLCEARNVVQDAELRGALSKRIMVLRRDAKWKWRENLVSMAAGGSWKALRQLTGLRPRSAFSVARAVPRALQDIHGDWVHFPCWADAAAERLRSVLHTAMPEGQVLDTMRNRLAQLRGLQALQTFRPVAAAEISAAITGTHTGKSMGTDGLTNEVFLSLTHVAVERLSDWFSRVLSGRLPWPEVWTLADVLMLPKKALPSSIKEYRPIAITAVSYKIFMRIVTRRLQDQLGSLFCGGQAAGRRGGQVSEVVSLVDCFLCRAREWSHPAYVLGLDVEAAFDSLEWTAILELFRRRPVSAEVEMAVLQSLMGQRLTTSIYGNTAATLTFPTRGVRQGAPESSVMFSAVIDMILQDVRDDLYVGLDMTIFFVGDPTSPRTAAWVDDIYLLSGTRAGIQDAVRAAAEQLSLRRSALSS